MKKSSGELNGFLDAGSHIQGELHFEDTFRVDGRVTGKVDSKGDLVVGDSGVVDGEIKVGRLFVTGTVKGSVEASRSVEISPGGKVYAQLRTASLVIEDGAFFQGECAMDDGKQAASTSPGKKASQAVQPKPANAKA